LFYIYTVYKINKHAQVFRFETDYFKAVHTVHCLNQCIQLIAPTKCMSLTLTYS